MNTFIHPFVMSSFTPFVMSSFTPFVLCPFIPFVLSLSKDEQSGAT